MPDVSFEVFLMRNGCAFSDGYCLGLHGECGSVCEFIRNKHRQICTIYKDFDDIHAFDLNDYIYSSIFHRNACGLCALYRFKKSNINSLKIVGRADMYKAVINDISIVKENLKVLDHCSSEDEYLKKMVFPKNSRTDCLMGMSCYYPEVRFE